VILPVSISIELPKVDISIDVSDWYVKEWRNDKALYDSCYDLLKDIPNKCGGVYFLYIDDELVYVGRSVNLKMRLAEHLVRNSNSKVYINDVTRIDCIKVDDIIDQQIYELHAIKTLKPKYNKSKISN
jgi:excinuclease UvrABC nuclease subunit